MNSPSQNDLSSSDQGRNQGPSMPTITIYQNSEHVSGLIQQMFQRPLLTDESWEANEDRRSTSAASTDAKLTLEGKFGLPALGLGAGGGGAREQSSSHGGESGATSRSIQNFVYSQAYYLYVVRDQLRAREQLKTVAGAADAAHLQIGDFIEFRSAFRPNELGALLDIATPQLVMELVRYNIRSRGIRGYDGWDDIDRIKAFSYVNIEKADASAAAAGAVVEAVRADFRSRQTREFYGHVGTADDLLTAVTICDNAHFVVEDEDRILDGEFTVLGKVVSSPVTDAPVLERNKVLDRIRPQAVDVIFELLKGAVDMQTQQDGAPSQLEGLTGADLVNVEFASRIHGLSVRVIPLAIYA